MINLRITEDDEVQFWAPWCGYFETLYEAEIIPRDSDMRFETGFY